MTGGTPTPEWPVTDAEILSALTAAALNDLPMDVDDEDFLPCCPHECAPCAALQALHDQGKLDDAVRPYVDHSGSGADWWLPWEGEAFNGGVRWSWVTERWCDPDTCESAHPDQMVATFEREEC